MAISQNHHDLFHSSGASDKLDLLQTLLDSHSLTSDEALALLNAVHMELQQPQGTDRSVYARYARMMETLRHEMPDIHQQVTTKWEQLHSTIQKKVTEDYASEIEPEKGSKNRAIINETSAHEEVPKKIHNSATVRKFTEDEGAEVPGGEEELEGPEPEEEVEEPELEEKNETEVEKYGEEVEEEEVEEKEAEEEGKEEEDQKGEETEAKEEMGEEEDKEEEEEEKQESEEEEEEKETEHKEKEEVEKEEVEEKEQEQEETEKEVEVEETAMEADHMATEAAEAAEEMEHEHVETEIAEKPEIEEFEINPGEEEPPMEEALG